MLGSAQSYKAILLGDQHVGKTSLLIRYMHDSFSPVTEETQHIDSKLKQIDNSAIQIWDTAGQENYYALNRIYFRRADACIFVVDVNSADFEQRLDFWINEFMTMGTPATQVNSDGSRTAHSSSVGSSDYHADQLQVVNSVFFSVLVNKVDKIQADAKIKIDQFEQKLQSWCQNTQLRYNIANTISKYFLSAKTGEGVEEAFNQIARDVISFHRVKKSHVNEKQLIEELRGSLISGYGGGASFKDSVLGGPTTELDGINQPTIYNQPLILTNQKRQVNQDKKGCC